MTDSLIARVISGGQEGVDKAALFVASEMHLPTGGTMPRGWRTQSGPRPEYAHLYGCVEHTSTSYGPRTFANVAAADATLRIAADFGSAGEVLTARACVAARKPMIDIDLTGVDCLVLGALDAYTIVGSYAFHVDEAIAELRRHAALLARPIVLNVAGNSERAAPGIEAAARVVCRRVFEGMVVA